ncbi:hypothetical protein Tco_1079768 [Tanacetum coccineum]|uniref:Uncharacterized protein n=1 Tax=Tanacetum coccineum TaxID=301880 RepID=A0ABQ5HUU3_9ASTR
MRVRNRLSGEFEPLVKDVNLQLSCFEKGLVKEMKDDLKYVMSLEDEFDETCLILDIQQEFFKTKFYIMGEPLSPDRVFDFPMDEPEPHLAYDFFAPGPLPGYVGNPNNNNRWIEADMPLLGELGAVANEPMAGLLVDEIAESIVKAEEQVITPVMDMDEDIAMLFGDDDIGDDDYEGFENEEEVWEVNEEWLMAPVTPPLMPVVPPPSVYGVGGPSIADVEG